MTDTTTIFRQKLHAETLGETMEVIDSPFVSDCSLVTCSGERGQKLAEAMRGRQCGSSTDGRQRYNLTPKRAEKAFTLFRHGYYAVAYPHAWRFSKDGDEASRTRPRELREAMNECWATENAKQTAETLP